MGRIHLKATVGILINQRSNFGFFAPRRQHIAVGRLFDTIFDLIVASLQGEHYAKCGFYRAANAIFKSFVASS